MKKTYRSPFLALNVKRRNEPVATDNVCCDTFTTQNGSKCAQAFVVTKTLVFDIYGMNSDKKIVNNLEDNIRQRGAMYKLILDIENSEISLRVKDTIRALLSDDWKH